MIAAAAPEQQMHRPLPPTVGISCQPGMRLLGFEAALVEIRLTAEIHH